MKRRVRRDRIRVFHIVPVQPRRERRCQGANQIGFAYLLLLLLACRAVALAEAGDRIRSLKIRPDLRVFLSALPIVRLEIPRPSTQRAGQKLAGCSRKRGLL